MACITSSQNRDIFCCFIFIHIILRLCDASFCQTSSSKFLVEPTDMQVLKGEHSVFQCSVADFTPRTQSVSWNVYPDLNVTARSIDKYDAENRILVSNITVHNHSKRTQLHISCILEEISQKKTLCFSSRQALMDTVYFPTQDELSCNPFPNEVDIGETLALTCSVPWGNPPVDLSWKVVPGGEMFPPSLHGEGSLRVLTHDLSITRNLHLKTVHCKVSSEFSFPGEKLQCSIGPIMVRHLPDVHVYPQTRSLKLHEPAELTCTADAYPEVNNFTWTCFPEGVLKGCDITSSSRHSFILNETSLCMSKVEGVHIECSATNVEGKGTGYAYLDIAKDIITCGNNHTIHPEEGYISSELPVNISLYQNLVTEVTVTSVHSTQKFPDELDPNGPIIEPIMMMVISGIVLLIAIIMIIISIYLCRVNRKALKEMSSSSNTMTFKPPIMSTHANIEIEDDIFYEIPNDHAAQTTPVVFVSNSSSSSTDNISSTFNQNLHHDYFSEEPPEISSVYSSDSQSDHYDEYSLQHSYASATQDALYENKGHVEIHFRKGKITKTNQSKAKRQQILEICKEYPMPEFPPIHGK